MCDNNKKVQFDWRKGKTASLNFSMLLLAFLLFFREQVSLGADLPRLAALPVPALPLPDPIFPPH